MVNYNSYNSQFNPCENQNIFIHIHILREHSQIYNIISLLVVKFQSSVQSTWFFSFIYKLMHFYPTTHIWLHCIYKYMYKKKTILKIGWYKNPRGFTIPILFFVFCGHYLFKIWILWVFQKHFSQNCAFCKYFSDFWSILSTILNINRLNRLEF